MKKIIINGKYKDAVYRHECTRCGCVFEFEHDDIDKYGSYPPEFIERWSITCPECGHENRFIAPNPIRYELSKNE